MIGNNSSGSQSIVYGTTVDHVHEYSVTGAGLILAPAVAVAILTAHTIGSGLPSEDACTTAFALSALGGLLAVGAALMVPPKADVAALAAEPAR